MKAFACMAGLALPLSALQLKAAGVKICCLSYRVVALRTQPISSRSGVMSVKELRAWLAREHLLGGVLGV